ncbi:MAG: fimbrillin family protein [Candidatus Cryptobacteroides sp.]
MKTVRLISLVLLLTGLAACRKDTGSGQPQPLLFCEVQTKVGLSSYYENFLVWAYCLSDTGSDIMPGYRVNYDPAYGWTYTEGEGTYEQELQYWSYSAEQFRFHAAAPLARVGSIDAESLSLNLQAGTDILETALYSEPYLVKRGDAAFGNTVNLAFVYANARLNLAFRCSSSAPVIITGIRLTPPSAYATRAVLDLSYDWSRPAVSASGLTILEQSSEDLVFQDLIIEASTSEPVATKSPWYLIPQTSVKGQWRLSLYIDGIYKEVDFTLSKGWEAGKSYLFRFEYTDEASLVFLGTSTELFIGLPPEDGGTHNFS